MQTDDVIFFRERNMIKTLTKFTIGAVLGAMVLATSAQAAGIEGTWRTPEGWKIKIYKCGSAHCGRVVSANGATDTNNPNAALRSRSMVGVRLIWGMRQSGPTYNGKLYNPKDGKTYTGKITPRSARSISLAGCALGGLICKSQTWNK